MIEITNYNNPILTSKAISIIETVLQSKKKAMILFYDLILISENERIKLMEFMEEHKNKFFMLDDNNIVNVDE
jgi:hypothetical protein